ncbi:hypothetical protein AVEN_150908-1 [Araneus ventricosus]|uniref:Uncharacterized protein n=1 Tax=Araneus ventricosus TaxID=182803 RepID=A0A4Y2C8H8_ARAVE|nr:hypothetical protein AVEN_150908-1 [Araneus ventricosus]
MYRRRSLQVLHGVSDRYKCITCGVALARRSGRGCIEERSPRGNRSSPETEVGVLTAIIGHGTAPPEGEMPRHRVEDSIAHHYYTPRRSENPVTYPVFSHPRTRGEQLHV